MSDCAFYLIVMGLVGLAWLLIRMVVLMPHSNGAGIDSVGKLDDLDKEVEGEDQ